MGDSAFKNTSSSALVSSSGSSSAASQQPPPSSSSSSSAAASDADADADGPSTAFVEKCAWQWRTGWIEGHRSLGHYGRCVSRTTNAEILSYLDVADVVSFGTACRAASAFAQDEWVWRRLFKQSFPFSALSKSLAVTDGVGHWRWAVILRRTG